MKHKLRVKDIIAQTGLDRETLRFYEQKGLLPQPSRTEAGYREFEPDILFRIQFIKRAQEVGFSLKEILDLLAMGEEQNVSKSELIEVAEQKITTLNSRIRALEAMRETLQQLTKQATSVKTKSQCPVLAQFKKLNL